MRAQISNYTAELEAMAAVMKALEGLEKASQASVLAWVGEKLGLQVGSPARADEGDGKLENEKPRRHQGRVGTVSTVANKLGADSCRTILIAAAVYLTLHAGKESFTRAEFVGCAKEARGWKADYINQASTMIGRLADAGVIIEKSKDVYVLSEASLKDYEAKLVD